MASFHTLSVNAQLDSKIEDLSLYLNHAQLTRIFRVKIVAGQNKVCVRSLPNVVDGESIRVEARGPVLIQGVTASKAEMQNTPETSPLLEELEEDRNRAEGVLKRCKKVLGAMDAYVGKLAVEHIPIAMLGEAMDMYDATEAKWDGLIAKTEKEILSIKKRLHEEEEKLSNDIPNKKLRTEVVVNLFGHEGGQAEIYLIYVVSHATWTAGYDIRAYTDSPQQPVRINYKAVISQKTGENWQNAPITLETSQPTFGVELPTLNPWTISHTMPIKKGKGGAKRYRKVIPSDGDLSFEEHETAGVTSQGHVVATFRIPGESNIPSSEEEHSVTIAQLDLEATLSWICIPKGDIRVHMKASIKNTSEYTFLPGTSNIYVDQSFISRSSIAHVLPGEEFICPLGIDPSIRVTYHPRTHMLSQTGFYNKSKKNIFSQRITIHNTKPTNVEGVNVTDNIPVSQDTNIVVNLTSPALERPTPTSSVKTQKIIVSPGVVACWTGPKDLNSEISATDQYGRVNWICDIPPHEKANILLQWEVLTTQKTEIFGLF